MTFPSWSAGLTPKLRNLNFKGMSDQNVDRTLSNSFHDNSDDLNTPVVVKLLMQSPPLEIKLSTRPGTERRCKENGAMRSFSPWQPHRSSKSLEYLDQRSNFIDKFFIHEDQREEWNIRLNTLRVNNLAKVYKQIKVCQQGPGEPLHTNTTLSSQIQKPIHSFINTLSSVLHLPNMNSRHSFLLTLTLLSLTIISPALCFPQQPVLKKETTTDPNSIDDETNTNTISHTFGPSEQLCALTWSNEAIRGKFQTTTTPPTFYCKNSGGSSYRCGGCGLVSSPNPIGPSDRKRMTTMSGKAYSCMAKNEKGISVQVGDSTCIAYSIADGGAGTIHCLSPTFEYLECLIGDNFPKFDKISCTGCLLYEADESDLGGIFRTSAPWKTLHLNFPSQSYQTIQKKLFLSVLFYQSFTINLPNMRFTTSSLVHTLFYSNFSQICCQNNNLSNQSTWFPSYYIIVSIYANICFNTSNQTYHLLSWVYIPFTKGSAAR